MTSHPLIEYVRKMSIKDVDRCAELAAEQLNKPVTGNDIAANLHDPLVDGYVLTNADGTIVGFSFYKNETVTVKTLKVLQITSPHDDVASALLERMTERAHNTQRQLVVAEDAP